MSTRYIYWNSKDGIPSKIELWESRGVVKIRMLQTFVCFKVD